MRLSKRRLCGLIVRGNRVLELSRGPNLLRRRWGSLRRMGLRRIRSASFWGGSISALLLRRTLPRRGGGLFLIIFSGLRGRLSRRANLRIHLVWTFLSIRGRGL